MTQAIKFEPHIRMFWSNTVDMILQRAGGENYPGKVGSFTAYEKIMSFVMHFLFRIQFENSQLEGRIHYVRPKEREGLRRNVSSQNDDVVKILNVAIGQVKRIVLSSTEIPAFIPTVEEPALVSVDPGGWQDVPLAVNLGIGTIAPLSHHLIGTMAELNRYEWNDQLRMFWNNTVDVMQRAEGENTPGKMGSFTTGKIMSFVMPFFFRMQFEKSQLEGRIYYIRPKEWKWLRRNVFSQNDAILKLLSDAIGQEKAIVPSSSEIPVFIPPVEESTLVSVDPNGWQDVPFPANLGIGTIIITLMPQPPVQQKINILSLCPYGLIIKLKDLEAATLGDEFEPVCNAEENAHAAILFTVAPAQLLIDEFEVSHIEKTDLRNTPLALVFFERNTDRTRYARPPASFANAPLLNKKHRAFHLIGSREAGLNKCKWNDQQCIEIRHFLREKALV